MVGERIQSRRPFSGAMLEMTIRETPVPEKDPEPMFPMDVIRSGSTVDAIEDDVKQVFSGVDTGVQNVLPNDDIKVTLESSFRRGFGQTDTYTIVVNISNATYMDVDDAVNELIDMGYKFTDIRFK